MPITININFVNHLINFLVCLLLTKIFHNMAKFSNKNEAILVLVKNLEGFLELLFRVGVFHFPCHKVEELREINCPIVVNINLIYHVLRLSFIWVLVW